MSIIQMTQDIADETGFPRPATAVGNTDLTVRRIMGKINEAGEYLRELVDWDILTREHTFTEVSGTADYALPADFLRFVPITTYNRTETLAFKGPLTPQEWQKVKSGGGVIVGEPAHRIKVDASSLALEFVVEPSPTASGDTFVFEYISTDWVKLNGGGDSDRFDKSGDTVSDSDSSLIPEVLVKREAKWRFLESLGLAYVVAQKEAQDMMRIYAGRQKGRYRSISAVPFLGPRPELASETPERGFG